MALETLAPDAHSATMMGSCILSDITSDPDSGDGNWCLASGNNTSGSVLCDFATPTGSPADGADKQEFRAEVRQFDTGQSGNPDARIELWENGTLVRAGSNVSITGSGQVIAFTWNATELATSDGSLVQANLVLTKSGGSPGSRNTVDVGGVEWNVDYTTASNQTVTVGTGIASTEAFGTASVDATITTSPSSISTAEALGSATLSTGVVIVTVDTGTASAEALGAPTVTPGSVQLSPGAIAGVEAFGTSTVFATNPAAYLDLDYLENDSDYISTPVDVTLSPTGLTSKENFNLPVLSVGPVTVTASSVTSDEAFGTLIIALMTTVSPNSIATTEAFGSATISTGVVSVSPSSIASDEALGSATVTPGVVTVSPTGVSTVEAVGSATLSTGGVIITGTGIASSGSVSSPVLNTLQLSGIGSLEAVSSPVLNIGAITVSPGSMTSLEAFGTLIIALSVSLSPTAISSLEAFGTTVLSSIITSSPSSLTSDEAFGTPEVTLAVITLSPGSVTSLESFGTTIVTPGVVTISPSALSTLEVFGTPTVSNAGGLDIIDMDGFGIASNEAFGHCFDVQHNWVNRLAAGLTKSERERQYAMNWGKDSHLDRTYD